MDRMKKESLSQTEMMELLLESFAERENSNDLAKKLISKFGGFSRALNAPIEDILKIRGMDEKTAKYLKSIPDFARYYVDDMQKSSKRVFDVNSAISNMRPKFIGMNRECLVAMLLNSKGQIVFNDIIFKGSITHVPLYIKDLIALCINYDAQTAFIAHNHTGGSPAPSRNDVVATKELQIALESLYMNLEDHIVFTEDSYTSMKKSGWISDIVRATDNFRKSLILEAMSAESELELENEI